MTTRKRKLFVLEDLPMGIRKKRRRRQRVRRRRVPRIAVTKENKFFDSDKDDAAVATGGAITTSIHLVPQNVTESGRIGRKITITKIMLSFSTFLPIAQDDADIPTGDVLRVILFLDTQANGANAAVTDLLESAEFDAYRNLANGGRFTFLMDQPYVMNRRVAMTDGTNTSASPNVTSTLIRKYFTVRIPVEFDAATGAITEIRTNNVSLLYISKNGVIGITTKVRIRYD